MNDQSENSQTSLWEFIKKTTQEVDSWPDWKKEGLDMIRLGERRQKTRSAEERELSKSPDKD
jgi:hypothetical protein